VSRHLGSNNLARAQLRQEKLAQPAGKHRHNYSLEKFPPKICAE
jgi:hypothetical protein